MNIDRKKFPLVAQIQNRQLNLPLSHVEYFKFFPHLPLVETILQSKPTIDYLCNSQFVEVLTHGKKFIGKEFDEVQGVLLTQLGTHVYKVKKNNTGCAEIDIYFFASDKLLYYFQLKESSKGLISDVATLYPNKEVEQNIIFTTILFLLFKKHVEIQKKVISTKVSRTCKTTTGKVKTDFKYPINVIDSYFFTDYINVLKTNVQPHKRHYKSGKVAEIEGFERSGYKRRAKKHSMAA